MKDLKMKDLKMKDLEMRDLEKKDFKNGGKASKSGFQLGNWLRSADDKEPTQNH